MGSAQCLAGVGRNPAQEVVLNVDQPAAISMAPSMTSCRLDVAQHSGDSMILTHKSSQTAASPLVKNADLW
ncbi:MAG: hypothetical protein ACLPV4_12380 [Solirubrobacteraceae bacterium]